MPKAPKWQASFNANLDQPISNELRLLGTAVLAHTSENVFVQSSRPGVLPDASVPGYWLANMRIGLQTIDDQYGFAIAADNLFNTADRPPPSGPG
jgi:hypothetical protein